MGKIIVTGVDGNFGGEVFKNIVKLVKKEDLILTCPFEAGLERFKEEGFETRVANFNHYEGLEEAFKDGEVVLIISAPFVGEKRQNAHKNAVDAAKAAGVKKVVYTSLVDARNSENPCIERLDHAYTEEYVIESGMDYIFLRNSQYAEAMITSYLTSNGMMISCQGEGKMSYISRKDCALAAAHALTKEDLHKQILNINGPESLTLNEFVAIGNKETGMDVSVKDATEEEVYAVFDAMGVPRTTDGKFKDGSPAPFASDGMVTFSRAIRLNMMQEFTTDFEKLTGQKGTTVGYMFANKDEYQIGNRNSIDV